MVTYCGMFIQELATLTAPLRSLLRCDTKWNWNEEHDVAFRKIKANLSTKTLLNYFDKNKKTSFIIDASPVGLGSLLVQKDNDNTSYKIINYSSRSLTPVEQRYSQTEREALAIYFGIKRFHMYLLGIEFDVVTDHKPLVPLFNNERSKPPMRIERWILNL